MTGAWLDALAVDLSLTEGATLLVVSEARLAHLRPLAQLALRTDPAPWVAYRASQVLEAPPGSLVVMVLEPGDEDSVLALNHARPVLAERGHRLVLVLLGPDGWTWSRLRERATDLAHWHSNVVEAPPTHRFSPALIRELRELGRWKPGLAWHGARQEAIEALEVAGYQVAPLDIGGPYPEVLERVRGCPPEAALVADEPWGDVARTGAAFRTQVWLRLERARLARQSVGHVGPLVVGGPWLGAGLLPFDGRWVEHAAWHGDANDLRLLGLLSDADPRLVRWADDQKRRQDSAKHPRGTHRPSFSLHGLLGALNEGPVGAAFEYHRASFTGHGFELVSWEERRDEKDRFWSAWKVCPGQPSDIPLGTPDVHAFRLRRNDATEAPLRASLHRFSAVGPLKYSLPSAQELAAGGGPARRPGFGALAAGSTEADVRFAAALAGDLGVLSAFGEHPAELPIVARRDPRFARGGLEREDLVDGTALDEVLRALVSRNEAGTARVLAHDLGCVALELWATLAEARARAQLGTAAATAEARSVLERVVEIGLAPTAAWAQAELDWLDGKGTTRDATFPDAFWEQPGFFEDLDETWRAWLARHPSP